MTEEHKERGRCSSSREPMRPEVNDKCKSERFRSEAAKSRRFSQVVRDEISNCNVATDENMVDGVNRPPVRSICSLGVAQERVVFRSPH